MIEANLNTTELSQLFQGYMGTALTDSARNPTAFANDVYNLTDTTGQHFVMRILKTQLPETVQMEAAMQTRLANAGIPTPKYLDLNEGGFVGTHEGTSFTLSERIEGETPTTASIELVADIGATLAKIHTSLDGVHIPPSKMQWFNLGNAKDDLDTYNGPLKESLLSLIAKGDQLFELDLPKSVTHGDLWLGNIFAKDDKVTAVFDLETAEYTYRIIDLARTYLSMRLETDYSAEKIIESLFYGYDSAANEHLSLSERENFPLAAAYVAGVCATWNANHGSRYAGPYIKFGEELLKS